MSDDRRLRLAIQSYKHMRNTAGPNKNIYCGVPTHAPLGERIHDRCWSDSFCRCDITPEVIAKFNYGYRIELER